jgi:hypothetical protein
MVGGSLSVLRRGGRFVEIGKRDIWAPAAAAAERPDVAYSLLAVDFLPDEGVQSALQRVAAGVAAGQLAPIPVVCHDLASAAAALRQLSQVSTHSMLRTQSISHCSCCSTSIACHLIVPLV